MLKRFGGRGRKLGWWLIEITLSVVDSKRRAQCWNTRFCFCESHDIVVVEAFSTVALRSVRYLVVCKNLIAEAEVALVNSL